MIVKVQILSFSPIYRDVAQFGSAPRLGRGGRWFESSYPDSLLYGVVAELVDVLGLEPSVFNRRASSSLVNPILSLSYN